MNKIILEIKAGEGGEDSKLFIRDMAKMYTKYAETIGAGLECL